MDHPSRTTIRDVTSRVTLHLRTPLYKTSYALVLSAGGTAALGVAYWAAATRTYSAHEVGVQSVVVSTILFLAGVSQLSLNSVLIRFVPVAGERSLRIVGWAYAASAVAAVAVGSVFVVGTPFWSSSLTFLLHDPRWFVFFVASTAIWCVFSLQDSALTGLRRATWVPFENIAVSAARIALVFLLHAALPHAGLVASWMIPAALAVVIVNVVVYRVARPVTTALVNAKEHSLRTIVRFAGGNYIGFVFYAASSNLLPLVVLNREGPSAAAYFFLPWSFTTALLLVGASTATSLTVETVQDVEQLHAYARRTLLHTVALLALPVTCFVLAGPEILHLFGGAYADRGGTALRLLALGVLPNAVVLIGLGVMRIRNRVGRLAWIQAFSCVLILGLSYLLLPHFGITGVGIAFLVSQVLTAVAVFLTELTAIVRRPAAVTSRAT